MPVIDKNTTITLLQENGILPLFYHEDSTVAIEVLKAAYAAGSRVFEFTDRGPGAYATFGLLAEYAHSELPGMSIGIGTIYDPATAEKFIAIGADFLIQPIMNPEVGAVCRKHDIPWLPGVSTLTEIYFARQAGSEVQKLFPGDSIGSSFIKAIQGPMSDVKIMVTGGVKPTKESFSEWFGVGAYAVGLGSNLFPKDVLQRKDYAWIQQTIADSLALVKEIRG